MKILDINDIIGSLRDHDKVFINGKYSSAKNGKKLLITSPIDGNAQFNICDGGTEDIDNAVDAARHSFNDGRWSDMLPAKRKTILLKLASLLEKKAEIFAGLDAVNMGKPIENSMNNDIPLAAECIRWYAESIDKLYSECVPSVPGAIGTIVREPLGVVGCITPWNYPMENIAWKLGPALAAGNSVVLKPAEQSTLSAIYIGKLANEAGIPEGVLNIVPGQGEKTGKALALHGDVDGIFFTGSSAVGLNMLQYSGLSNMKKVALECGGKSPFIILKDCYDLEVAANMLAQCMFFNQGQICTAPSRLIVEESVHDEIINHLLKCLPQFCPGNPLDYSTRIGAMSSHRQLERVLKYVESGKKEGANLIAGGDCPMPVKEGAYMNPTIFDSVNNNMRIAQEEIFGPVLSVISVKNHEEAIKIANDCKYGLAAAIWTSDINKAHNIARKIKAGIVHINSYGEDNITAPFGGCKYSGNGTKDKSLHALYDYTEIKTTWLKITK